VFGIVLRVTINSLCRINRLAFIKEMQSVSCETGANTAYVI
jgi:hypothetical protein